MKIQYFIFTFILLPAVPLCATEQKDDAQQLALVGQSKTPFHCLRRTFEHEIMLHQMALEKNKKTYTDKQYKNVIVEAQEQKIKSFIAQHPELLTEQLYFQSSCAPLACQYLTIPMTKLLIQTGASTNANWTQGEYKNLSVLYFHLYEDNSPTQLLTLLQKGANPTRAGGPYASMLHAAIDIIPLTYRKENRKKLQQKVRYLVLYGCDLDCIDKYKHTALERVQTKLDKLFVPDTHLLTAQEAQEAYQPLRDTILHGHKQREKAFNAITSTLSQYPMPLEVINLIGHYSLHCKIPPEKPKA